MTTVNQNKDSLWFVNSSKFWRNYCLALSIPGFLLLFSSLLFKNHESTFGTFGGLLLFLAWIGYCVLEGLKREREMAENKAAPCPYKIESSSSYPDFLVDRDR